MGPLVDVSVTSPVVSNTNTGFPCSSFRTYGCLASLEATPLAMVIFGKSASIGFISSITPENTMVVRIRNTSHVSIISSSRNRAAMPRHCNATSW
jgi:hypothetical protein